MGSVPPGRVARGVVLDLWPAVLAVVLCLPLLTRAGHPLARDLVFTPRLPWSDDVIGLGDAAPRAVPLDALVSLATTVVDGGVLARIVIPLVLAAAGWGAHRLVRDLGTTARLVAGGAAVWNPYVVERLALGQWALLAGYAALPWLVVAARRYRDCGGAPALGVTTAWLGLASLTPTGGLLGSVVAVAAGAGRTWRTAVLAAVAVLLQLPWLLPSLLGSGVTSDPDAVTAFSAGAEGPGGVLLSLLGLGGIWDAGSVPVSRDSWWGPATAVVVVLALVLGRRVLRGPAGLLLWPAVGGFALALLSSVPGGDSLVRWLVETVPGAGLLRDAQKFLAPYAMLVAACAAGAAERAVRAAARHGTEVALAAAILVVGAPLMLLPDGAPTTWPTLDPVGYPSGLDTVGRVLDQAGEGDLAALPWRSYRRFSWGNGLVSSDPALRWFGRDVVASDDLQVGEVLVAGEGRRAARVGERLASEAVAPALAAEGVAWALVYRDDPAADDLDLSGLVEVYADRDLALYRVPDARPAPAGASPGARALVLTVDGVALGLVLAGLLVSLGRAVSRVRNVPRR